MATPLEEASAAATAFQVALAKIGAATIAEALIIWKRMSAKDPEGTAAAWLEDAIQMVMSRRGQSRELAMAFYRLTRALVTGSTVPDPRNPEPTYVTLGDLRTAFSDLAESSLPDDEDDDLYVPVEPSDAAVKERTDAPGETVEREDLDHDLIDMTEEELIEAILDDVRQTEGEWDEEDDAAEEELRIVLEALGKDGLIKRIEQGEDPDKAHEQSGARQAAATARVAMNGARGDQARQGKNDPRIIGYARYSRTGTPCGWCAMLISRGLFMYSSEESATLTSEGELYHDNCKCAGMPIYSREQYMQDSNYDMNRLYGAWWPEVTDGTGGKVAVGLWRKFFNLTGEMPEGERLAYWKRWLASAEGQKFEKALEERNR